MAQMEVNSNADHAGAPKGPRHSILDLAPLELECMTVLWPLGAGTVREIHHRLTLSRPRAYTTVLTIMDRLAQKGIVTRRKVGRAYCYEPRLSVQEARLNAIGKIVEGFFDGSPQALAAHLSSQGDASPGLPSAPPALGALAPVAYTEPQRSALEDGVREAPRKVDVPGTSAKESPTQNLDETLL